MNTFTVKSFYSLKVSSSHYSKTDCLVLYTCRILGGGGGGDKQIIISLLVPNYANLWFGKHGKHMLELISFAPAWFLNVDI